MNSRLRSGIKRLVRPLVRPLSARFGHLNARIEGNEARLEQVRAEFVYKVSAIDAQLDTLQARAGALTARAEEIRIAVEELKAAATARQTSLTVLDARTAAADRVLAEMMDNIWYQGAQARQRRREDLGIKPPAELESGDPPLSVSVVVCTLNRSQSLANTLASLERLSYPRVELVVVVGPCTDDTMSVVSPRKDRIKLVRSDAANLSVSRNLGIAEASGEIVAFIDDDALVDPEWLEQLVDAFEDPEVGATGGPVYDHTGYALQARFALANRFGEAHVEIDPRSLAHLEHPDTWNFVFTVGTNSLFRRSALIEIGGFDENFAFYLDETDTCLRLIDNGWRIVARDVGAVYHKFLPSGIRNESRITFDRYNVLLSRAYFGLRHGLPRVGEAATEEAYRRFVADHRADLVSLEASGRIPHNAVSKFDRDVTDATDLARQLVAHPKRTRDAEWFGCHGREFLSLTTTPRGPRRLRVCILSQDYPPGPVHGMAGATLSLAREQAGAGHIVHVITDQPDGPSTVDLEDGVWVHRLERGAPGQPRVADLPASASDRFASALREISRINSATSIDLVYAPKGDSEALAVIRDSGYATSVYA